MGKFVHLHVHSHYSILDGMSKVPELISRAQELGMNAIALTDHGNMFGIKELVDTTESVNGKTKGKIKDLEKEAAADDTSDERKQEIAKEIEKLKGQTFKCIVGVEAYCARRSLGLKDSTVKMVDPESGRERIVDSSGWHLILLAKNKTGYQNLCKLVSISWMDGFYNRPRIDKEILEKYHEGVIVCSACLGGEIPQLIMAGKVDEAEKSINWFKSIFGDDYYLEVQRHQTDKPNADRNVYERQKEVVPVIMELARKTNTKVIATNDVHFVREEYAEAHDRLVCLSTGKNITDENRMHYTKQEFLKSPEQMEAIFADMPEVISNTLEIADKVEPFGLNSDPIMPKFPIPEDFGTEEQYRERITEKDLFDEFTQDENGNVVLSQEDAEAKIKKLGGYDKLYRIKLEADYLGKLAWEGAKLRYGDQLTGEQHDRIKFELHIMKTMGFPGYFLIVRDYIRAAREELGVSVGPGRGSAAGSVVAYCLGITDIDPLKYDLLFERFLNPDRISLPDIDVDFDDDGRAKVLDYVTRKYGKERVAHIITYGVMAAKSAIADVARVQALPLSVSNNIKNLIPAMKFDDSIKDEKGKVPKVSVKNCLKYLPEFKDMYRTAENDVKEVVDFAVELEGTVRQIGIHACGVIIGADDLTKFAPLATVKDKGTGQDQIVTQYDGHVVESVGLIKMDFLGLSTLSIIKEALKNIKKSKGIDLDINKIPIDDKKTYELYSNGETIATFQFESPGMQKYLRELQPTVFEDLIAMNALYRPGPMSYIPQFIARKQGKEPVTYDIPVMEKYLKDTYGITVYQEQVMLLSRLLADFTRGESDALRKAMGKKKKDIVDKMKPKFIEGGKRHGYDPKVLEKIWADWEHFASYAFNKSHATCYSWVSYQTAYLKAHYPAEFMAANLTRNKDNMENITKFMDECKRMGIEVLCPDVNESELNFTVNERGSIRFGLGGVRGVGEGAVEAIVKERERGGAFKDIYNFMERVDLSACNKKAIESLAFAGAFDSFPDAIREQYFEMNQDGQLAFYEPLARYGADYQSDRGLNQNTLFDLEDLNTIIKKPALPKAQRWNSLMKLNKEKEMVGIYLSSHPLDDYYVEMNSFCNMSCERLNAILNDTEGRYSTVGAPDFVNNKDFHVGGLVIAQRQGVSKKGNQFGVITIADYTGKYDVFLMGNDLLNYGKFMMEGIYIMVHGTILDRRALWSKYPPTLTKGEVVALGVRTNRIMVMNDICEKYAETLTIRVDLDRITDVVAKKLTTLLKEKALNDDGSVDHDLSRGNLKLVVCFKIKNRWVSTRSRSVRVAMSKSLEDFLRVERLRGILDFTLK